MKETTRIERLLGKEFIYKQNNIRIKDYYQVPEKGEFKIITDGSPITVKEKDIAKFCEDLLAVQAPETGVSLQVAEQATGLLAILQKTLLDNIEMVKQDKEYIKQANVVNSSVNALIGMAKLQIQVGKMKPGK